MRPRWIVPLLSLIALSCRPAGPAARGPDPAPSGALPALRAAIDSIADASQFRNAHWGIVIVGERGDTLYSRNAGKLFMPASNQKILTSAVALAQLGPEFRYRTTFLAAPPVDGVLKDLFVVGRGDPTVSDHMMGDAMQPLRAVADSLRAKGVRAIAGRVVAEGDAFPGATLGFGWSWDDLEEGFSAPIDELLFNEGFSRIVASYPRNATTVVAIERPAPGLHPIRIEARGVARLAGDTARNATAARVVKDTATGELVLTGRIAAGDSAMLVATHRDPAAAFVGAMRIALAERGIRQPEELGPRIAKEPDTARTIPVGARRDTLVVLTSPPLRDILPALMKPSQNQIAEMLFRTVALEKGSRGTAAEAQRIFGEQLRAWGAQPDGFVVRDGSGLSRYNFVSPETILRVLDAMRRAPTFDVFYQSLPIAGVDGTLRNRMRGTAAENNVRAKTGSFSQARSLSGYVRTADGELLTFSTMANNWSTPAAAVTMAQDSIMARLARFRR